MNIVCLDLEGVLIPEIWIEFAKRSGIDALRATTRDVPDYDVLMRQRLRILKEHQLGLLDIQKVIATMKPMLGAKEFLDWVRSEFQLVILSDTFYEFAMPLMRQLGHPTLMCHRLSTDVGGFVNDYHLRQQDQKRMAVKAFHSLNYKIIAAGDSYNDIGMLREADAGFFFCPPDNIVVEFPQFKVVRDYGALQRVISETQQGFK